MPSWPTSSSLSGDSALYRILADYWEAVERGESPDQAEWLARYPEFHDELSDFFADWSRMHRPAGTWPSAVPEEDSKEPPSPPDNLPDSPSSTPRSVRNPAAPDAMFGDYELLAELGRGGMGEV